jgi:hypothetical protein
VADFNPFSLDAQVATVIEKLKHQDRKSAEMHAQNTKVLGEILIQAKATNGRVTKLEMQWRYVMGCAAGISLIIGAVWAAFVHLAK